MGGAISKTRSYYNPSHAQMVGFIFDADDAFAVHMGCNQCLLPA
jgi:hypothetical protein